MANHKLVTISIFAFQNMRTMHFFYLYKTMLEKLLEFDCMQENKKKLFFKEEINLNFFRDVFEFFKFLETFRRKPGILIRSASYNVNIQPDIIQNWYKKMQEITNILK
jgi:hypothetical protein